MEAVPARHAEQNPQRAADAQPAAQEFFAVDNRRSAAVQQRLALVAQNSAPLVAQRAAAAKANAPVQRVPIGDYDTDEEEVFKLALEEMARRGDVKNLNRYHDALRKMVDSVDYRMVDYQDPKPFRLLSVAKLALAKLTPLPEKISPTAQIYELPKSEWWRLFIDARYHSENNPLKFDYQQSPGFFSAMMSAFEEVFGAPPEKPAQRSGFSAFMGSIASEFSSLIASGPKKLTAEQYQHYHDLVRRKVLTQPGGKPLFSTIEFGWSNTSTNFGANEPGGLEPDAEALAELINEGIAYVENPELFPDPLPAPRTDAFVAIKIMFDKGTGSRLFQCACKFNESQAPLIIESILAAYYDEVARANKKPLLVIAAIVRLIRNLHVGHFFTDANGRINIMLLLNKFLMENGLPPVILTVNPGVFGGLMSVPKLVQTVAAGIKNFHLTVETLKRDALKFESFRSDDKESKGEFPDLSALSEPSASLGSGERKPESSSSLVRPRRVDLFNVYGTPYAVNDPSIRDLGECFWDTLRKHGISNEDLADAAKEVGVQVDKDFFVDTAWRLIQAINAKRKTAFALQIDRFDIKSGKELGQELKGSGKDEVIRIGFAIERESSLGHFIPPYRG